MNNQDLEHIQQTISYRFKNLDLLQQAFVRRSYSEENGGEDNEVLEFIGDRVLDMIVVKLLTEKYGFMLGNLDETEDFDEFACKKNEAELTEIKRQLVQKRHLAHRIDTLGLADYLITGKGDQSWNENSVKEDLFEAIIGAATIDSKWNMEELQVLVEIMLDPEIMMNDEHDNYIARIQDWTAKKGIGTPLYYFEEESYTSTWYVRSNTIDQRLNPGDELAHKTKFHCFIKISEDILPFRGFGASKTEARQNACKTAYQYLESKGLLFSIQDEIPNPNKENAISQLETLARRGYFSIPTYSFSEEYDSNGNPVWRCKCSIREKEYMHNASSSSKKDAKKQTAWKMLQQILDMED